MKKNLKITIGIISALLTTLMILGMIFLLTELEWYIKVLVYGIIIIFFIATFLFMFLGKEKLCKSIFVFNIILFIVLSIFFVLNLIGLFEEISDIGYIKHLILSSKGWGVLICFTLILLNVVVPPLPGMIVYVAITAIYGPIWGFIISYVGTVVGSIIAFAIGRMFGKKTVEWCIGESDTQKYSSLLNKKGKIPFIIMQILPFFPDDILCMVAGLSTMSYRFFIITMIFVKFISIFSVCILGTGDIIPFSGWGIPVWILIFSVILVICALYLKNQDKVDSSIKEFFYKKNNKENSSEKKF